MASGWTKYDWGKLKQRFFNSALSRHAFFLQEGIATSVYSVHSDKTWDEQRKVYKARVAELAESKNIERAATKLSKLDEIIENMVTVPTSHLLPAVKDPVTGLETGEVKLKDGLTDDQVIQIQRTGLNYKVRMEELKRKQGLSVELDGTRQTGPRIVINIPSNGFESDGLNDGE
jgi:hypothetical protein